LTFRQRFTNFNQQNVGDRIFIFTNCKLKFPDEFGGCLSHRISRLGNNSFRGSSRGFSGGVGSNLLPNFGAASEKESISTNSLSEPDGQCS
jgi:hypothetical protein